MHKAICFLVFIATAVTAYTAAPLTKEDCLPGVNTKGTTGFGTFRDELACLKAGFKKIIWNDIGKRNGSELIADRFTILDSPDEYTKKRNGPSFHVIIYKTDDTTAEKQALLFQKYLLELELCEYLKTLDKAINPNDPHISNFMQNDYAIGKLLDYPEEEITLFYQRQEARKSKIDDKKITSVETWANQNKEKWEPHLAKDKERYNKWFDLNKSLHIDVLRQQINALIELIKNRTQIPGVIEIKTTKTLTEQLKEEADLVKSTISTSSTAEQPAPQVTTQPTEKKSQP